MPDWLSFVAPSVHLGELFVRGTITYLGLTFLLRIVGRREAGGLGLTDLMVVLLAVNAATTGLTGDSETVSDGFILVVTVLFWSVVLDALSYRWPRLERLIKARPRALITKGEINPRVLRRELMTEHEVISQLRLHGISDLSRVQQAYIEPNGMVSVMLREPPETPEASRPPEL